MDLPSYVNAFFEFTRTYQPVLDSAINLGTSVFTIGSSLVKVLQKGKHLATVAVGKKKAEARSKIKPKAKSVQTKGSSAIAPKTNVAIVVEISRPAVQDAAHFLAKNKIDANLVVITAARGKRQSMNGLNDSNPKSWVEVLQEFNAAINAVKAEMGAVRMHVFLATPVALAFGLGTIWGTVDESVIYHWNGKQYKRVLLVSRKLRFQLSEKE